MDTATEILDRILYYILEGVEVAMDFLLTIEGIVVVIILSFLVGFISRIRSI